MNSRQKLHSAAVIRILESIGVIGKSIPIPITANKFQVYENKNQKIWGGKIKIDGSSDLLLFYSEIDSIKYLVTKLIATTNSSVLWYVVGCGDETGEDYSVNSIFTFWDSPNCKNKLFMHLFKFDKVFYCFFVPRI